MGRKLKKLHPLRAWFNPEETKDRSNSVDALCQCVLCNPFCHISEHHDQRLLGRIFTVPFQILSGLRQETSRKEGCSEAWAHTNSMTTSNLVLHCSYSS